MESPTKENIKGLVRDWLRSAVDDAEDARGLFGRCNPEVLQEERDDLKKIKIRFRKFLSAKNYPEVEYLAGTLLREEGFEVKKDGLAV